MVKLAQGLLLLSLSPVAFATVPNGIAFVPQSVPAVSQAGLIALAFVVGIVGARIIHKLKAEQA